MKHRNTLLLLMIIVVVFSACNRAFTPSDAANHPRGMKCRSLN
ncbi:MAG: hypothetical protein JWM28_3876 [Chitinophagaceae bacterium]|nr:hypothetical protein [Chitinophagaceae bacterium]